MQRKKAQYSINNGAEGKERLVNLVKPQINHNKTISKTHQTTRTSIHLKIWE